MPDRSPAVPDGLSAFPITPMDDAGRVDLAGLRRLLARLLDAQVDSIGLLGSTGTYAYLDRAERRRTIAAAVEQAGGRVPILAGIGALRTDEACALARDAREAGAAAGLLAPVSYTPLRDEEVFRHVVAVAEASGLPVCLYNNPSTTHFTFSADLVARLAAVPGVVAVKNPAGPDVAAAHAALAGRVPNGFSVGYSVDWLCTEAMIAGGRVWYSVAGGVFPKPVRAIVTAVRRGDAAEARRLDRALEPLWEAFRRHTSLRVVHHAASGPLRLCPGAVLPRPILPLGPEAGAEVDRVLAELDTA